MQLDHLIADRDGKTELPASEKNVDCGRQTKATVRLERTAGMFMYQLNKAMQRQSILLQKTGSAGSPHFTTANQGWFIGVRGLGTRTSGFGP